MNYYLISKRGASFTVREIPQKPSFIAGSAVVVELEAEPAMGMLEGLYNAAMEIPPVPDAIENWRCRAILKQMGLLQQVDTLIGNLSEPQKSVVDAAWNGGAIISREGPTVLSMPDALGLTPEQVDDMFRAGAALTV